MHKDCVLHQLRVTLVAMALGIGTIAPSSAAEMWYARAARGFDLPVALPDPVPVPPDVERLEARPSESCVPPTQYLLWTLEVEGTDFPGTVLPISLYRPASLREALAISVRPSTAVATERLR
jgi:hypothetical protein